MLRITEALADRYRVEREIGAGGMATVYLAEDIKHRRKVAIKVLKPELAAVLGADRFVQEITTTAALQHPHILPLFDSGSADGFLFYVMPYIEGETLRTKLDRETQLGIDDALRITREIGDALDYAHRHGVIHRDIKPENILLHGEHALVADFGIALAVQHAGSARLTQTGLSLGTPQYMSPEQAMGDKSLDARVDIYALGAVLYEMLSGEPPFVGANSQAIIAKVMTERPHSLCAVRDTIPTQVETAIFVALSRLPADRFPTAQAFTAALSSGMVFGTGLSAPRRTQRTPTPASTRLWQSTALAAVVIAAVALFRPVGRHTPGVLVRRQLTFEGNVRGTAISPDGLWLAYLLDDCAVADHNPCTATLKVREIDGSQSIPIATWRFIASDMRWSGDGRTLVFQGTEKGGDNSVFFSDRLGGTPRRLQVSPTAMSVMADGTSLMTASGPATQQWLRRYSIATMALLDSARLPPHVEISALTASPHDGTLAATAIIGGHLVQMLLLTPTGHLLDSATVPARSALRWDSGGTAVLAFDDGEGGGIGDDLLRIGVAGQAFEHKPPHVLLGQISTGDGLLDVARTGRMVLVSGPQNARVLMGSLSAPTAPWLVVAQPTGYLGPNVNFTPAGDGLTVSQGDNLSGNFYTYPLQGGSPRQLSSYRSWLPIDGKWGDNPDYSPDGTHMVFNRGNGTDADVVFTDSAGGHDRIIAKNSGSQGDWTPRWLTNDRVIIFRNSAFVVVDTGGAARDSLRIPDSLALGGGYTNLVNVMETSVYFWSDAAGAIVVADIGAHVLRIVDRPTLRMRPVGWTRSGEFIAVGTTRRVPTLYRFDDHTRTFVKLLDAPKNCGGFTLDRSGSRAACTQREAHRDVWLAVAAP